MNYSYDELIRQAMDAETSQRRLPDSTEDRASGEWRSRQAVGLGRYLRAARLNSELTYDELAGRCGLDRVFLIGLEAGLFPPRRIRPDWLRRLAAALGEDVDDLFLLAGERVETQKTAESRQTVLLQLGLEIRDAQPYLSGGWLDSRERYRPNRPRRDPERQFFDK